MAEKFGAEAWCFPRRERLFAGRNTATADSCFVLLDLRDVGLDGEVLAEVTGTVYGGGDGTLHCETYCAPKNAVLKTVALTSVLDGRERLCPGCATSWKMKALFRTSGGMLLRHAIERSALAIRETKWLAGRDWTELADRGGWLWLEQQMQWSAVHRELGSGMAGLYNQSRQSQQELADLAGSEALGRWAAWAATATKTAMTTTWFGTDRANVRGRLPAGPLRGPVTHLVAIQRDLGILGPAQLLLICGIKPTVLAVNEPTAHTIAQWGGVFGWDVVTQPCANPHLGSDLARALLEGLPAGGALKSAAAVTA